MTGEEKRNKMKEEYKEELKKRKEFLDQAKKLRSSRKINDAIQQITGAINNDDSDEWIDKLNMDSAVTEAKLDMFMDASSETSSKIDQLKNDTELAKSSAQNLIEEMKKEMGMLDMEDVPSEDDIINDIMNEEKPEDKPKKSLGDI
ncbi:MAG: hypothetical protein AAFO96_24890 [Bacteroidota bacterium]